MTTPVDRRNVVCMTTTATYEPTNRFAVVCAACAVSVYDDAKVDSFLSDLSRTAVPDFYAELSDAVAGIRSNPMAYLG